MSRIQSLILLALFIVCALLGKNYFDHFKIESNILSSLNQKIYNKEVTDAFTEYERRLSTQIIIMLSGEDFETVKEAAESISKKLTKSDLFTEIRFKQSTQDNIDFSTFFYKHKRKLLTKSQIEIINQGEVENLEKRAIKKLYNPLTFSASQFQHDPYLLMDDFFTELKGETKVKIRDNYFTVSSKGKDSILLRTSIKNKGFATRALDELRIIQKEESEIKVYFSSLAFYEVKAKEQAFFESNIFSLVSLTLILFLFYLFFKTFRHILVSLAVIGLSASLGLYITTLIMGPIHMISLLLGISVLGVIADYFIHFFVEEYDELVSTSKEAILKIKKPMIYSFITTGLGFLIFTLVPLQIIHQFSLFAITTLIFAMAMVFFILPHFYIPNQSTNFKSLNETLQLKTSHLFSSKIILLILVLISLTSILVRPVDNDIRTFSKRDSELFTQEKNIQSALGISGSFEQFILFADTRQKIIEQEEELKKILNGKHIEASYLSNIVPSMKRQKQSKESYLILDKTVDSLFKRVQAKNTKDIKNRMRASIEEYITIDTAPIKDFSLQYIGSVGENFYSIVPILRNRENINLSTLNSKNRIYVNKISTINTVLNKLSKKILWGLLLFFILCLIFFRYKFGFKKSLKLLMPTSLSVIFSLGLSAFVFSGINIFQLLASILIIGLGLDYSFFYFFNRSHSRVVSKAVTLSTLTTLSSFGVLCFSSTAAVQSFGFATATGIIVCWLLVPTISIGDINE